MTRHGLSRQSRTAAGFTLVEIMVALAIGLAVVGALASAYVASFASGRRSDAIAQMTEDAALALDVMRQQVAQAGFTQPHGSTGGTLVLHRFPAVSGCAAANFADLGASILVPDNCRASASDPAASDSLEVAFESSVLAGKASNGILGGPDGAQPLDCLGNSFPQTHDAATADAYWLNDSKFYLAGGSLFCHGPGNPAGAAVVQNIEMLQVTYGMAAAPPGLPGAGQIAWYGQAPPPGSPLWADVISVNLCVQVRSAAPVLDTSAVGTLGVWIDCRNAPRKADDGYLRRSFTTTVVLQNRLP